MRKAALNKIVIVISILLIAVFFVSACDSPEPRIPEAFYLNAGVFQTNVNDDDPRRQVRCTIVFEVVDERALEELADVEFIMRNAVLSVLSELTIPEITKDRDFEDISQRIVDRVNEDMPSPYELFIRAYFTDFALV